MNAQEAWKSEYRRFKKERTHGWTSTAWQIINYARRYSREAALERKLEAANRRIAELQDQVWRLEAQEHNRDDGNEWEKKYYLRGMR